MKRWTLLAVIVVVVGGAANSCGGSTEPPASPSSTSSTPTPGQRCGVERWSVKTLSDQDAASLSLQQVAVTTVRALNELPSHCEGGPDRRSYAEEFRVYEVLGRVTRMALEDDRDYHVVLADPADPSFSIVTEVADPVCSGVSSSPYLELLTQARSQMMTLSSNSPASLTGRTIRLRGVGFYDFDHNQIGRSRNCLELHPVVSMAAGS